MSEEARIAALPLWQDRPVIEPVPAGRTNRNFVVRDREQRYFARAGAEVVGELPHLRELLLRRADLDAAPVLAHQGVKRRIVVQGDGTQLGDRHVGSGDLLLVNAFEKRASGGGPRRR